MSDGLSGCIRQLSWQLVRHLQKKKTAEEFVISPISISIALCMLAGAAGAEQRSQIYEKLGVLDHSILVEALENISNSQSSATGDAPIIIANGLFVKDHLTIKSDYLAILKSFATEVARYPNLAVKTNTINAWISEHTRGKINGMLQPSSLIDAEIVLINAIAFKGLWRMPFDHEDTKKNHSFWVAGQDAKRVDMMFLYSEKVLVHSADTYLAVRLPYEKLDGQPQIYFQAYLPHKDQELSQLLNRFASDLMSFKSTTIFKFGLPKFVSETSENVTSMLEAVGFPLHGEWPAFGNRSPGDSCDRVYHKAMIEVDEKGTEAAAATAVVSYRKGAPRTEAPSIIIFDRPFAYSIVDEVGMTLFAGIYS